MKYFNEVKPLIEDKQKLARYEALFAILAEDTGMDVVYKMGNKNEIDAYMEKYAKYIDMSAGMVSESEYQKALGDLEKNREEEKKQQEAEHKKIAAQQQAAAESETAEQ